MEELIKGIKKYIGIIKIAFQVATVLRNLPADAGDLRDTGSDFGLGRPPGGENGTPLQYFCEKKKKIPWTEETGGLQLMLSQRIRPN